jgi:phytoene dehydrogenase-like protein
MTEAADVVVVGAGHNGLVAATILARAGLRVRVVESRVAGGAARTEYPFAHAPGLGVSSGAYLVGLVPPELVRILGADLPLLRRDPHYFLPTLDRRYLLLGANAAETRRQCVEFFSERDAEAIEALTAEIGAIRDDVGQSWLSEPLPAEETAERFVRPALRQVFLELVRQPVEHYLARFGFTSDLLLAMFAVTDGFSGLSAGFGMPGTGMNFLVHNMCRLPGADGTWMIPKGGMGAVAREFVRLAASAGAIVTTGNGAAQILTSGGSVTGVLLQDGTEIKASVVVSGADPFRLRDLVGREEFSPVFNAKLDTFKRTGTTLKVNLALDRLPRFTCLPEDRGQFNGTIHLMPQGDDVVGQIRRAFEDARAGRLAEFPTIEWYTQTTVDPSLKDAAGRHSGALFVQWAPYELAAGSWEEAEPRYVRHLLSILDRFAPGTSDCVIDTFTLTPPKIEAHFGMTGGHIHHVDNSVGFDERMPYRTSIGGLYACSAGCHPAGSVIGAAGYVGAQCVLSDMNRSIAAR